MSEQAESTQKTQLPFQAEISQLLQLLSHSLYQNREIALRELVSNASDALDKFRYLTLVGDPSRTASGNAAGDGSDLRISIEPQKDDRILVIRDNGLGMTREELISHLGTIARSGSLEFIRNLTAAGKSAADVSLIGQFGVGFYSAFMLAARVEVVTRSHREESGWVWESVGDGQYSISEATAVVPRGTQIRLHLKEDLDEYTDPIRLRYILRKYSTFVPHPIFLGDEHINNQPPIWVEPKTSLREEQYHSFYEYLTHFPGQKPLWYLHLSADSPFQFHSILYCPDKNLERMGFGRADHGLHLCARRILVQSDNRDLLPDYLRFLRGIVDSADLPLNVSREALQDNTVFRRMQKVITRKVLDQLESLAADDADCYLHFYREFGTILREGAGGDFDNRDRIARLLRFASTHSESGGRLVSLEQYCSRAADDQKQIYFVTGSDATSVLRDPNLEIFRSRSLEVLLLTDPADEYVLSTLRKFQERDLVSVDAADLKLPEKSAASADSPDSSASTSSPESEAGLTELLKLFREALADQVQDVRRSERLTESDCCLVNAQGSMSTTMQRVLRMNTPDFEMARMILEVNPKSSLVRRLAEIAVNPENAAFLQECGRQLHANAMIMAGLAPNGNEMASRMHGFLLQLAQQRSAIIL